MAKYLRLGDDPRAERWPLPDDTDLDELRTRISGAMNDGTAVPVHVRVGERGTGELVVNGRAVSAVLLWEEGGTRPSFTLID